MSRTSTQDLRGSRITRPLRHDEEGGTRTVDNVVDTFRGGLLARAAQIDERPAAQMRHETHCSQVTYGERSGENDA